MADGKTTIQLPIPLNKRIENLAAVRSKKLGLSKQLAQYQLLELLVTEEENRLKEEL